MKKLKDYFESRWLVLAVTLTVVVVVLTHVPQELTPSQLQGSGLDKFLHAAAYGAIAFILVLSIKATFSVPWALLFLLVLLGIGSLDEITQPLVSRQASFGDLLANVFGILTVFSLSIIFRQRLQKLKTESASPLCFTAVVAFMAGALALPVALIPLKMLKGPGLPEKQKEASSFFYKTMNEFFEGSYNPEDGAVSDEALNMLNELGPESGGKCWLLIYDDWYSQQRQRKGYFFGPAFFPSGDMFEVEIERVGKRLVLKKFRRGDWDAAWQEMMKSSNPDTVN
jgi:VanZ family protein